MKLLYHCPVPEGGLAEYSRHQAEALGKLGPIEVLWQGPAEVIVPHGAVATEPLRVVKRSRGRSKWHRAFHFAADTLAPYGALAREIKQKKPDAVILSAWSEYFAPFWAPRLRRLRKRGVRFGAVVHEPVRLTVRGPLWWHRHSVREAYSFLDVVFTHDAVALDSCGSQNAFRILEVPHGPYRTPEGSADRSSLRREMNIPEQAKVILAFGHIRDGKNLDQIIHTLRKLQDVHLLVSGREQSGGERPVSFYQQLARELGVAERCHWHGGYVSEDEVWKYFRASDVLALTYSTNFRSASGVLNVNAQFRLPVIVSGGDGPLLKTTRKYGLGVVIDKPEAGLIASAFAQANSLTSDWDRFASENSWETNAKLVAEGLGGRPVR